MDKQRRLFDYSKIRAKAVASGADDWTPSASEQKQEYRNGKKAGQAWGKTATPEQLERIRDRLPRCKSADFLTDMLPCWLMGEKHHDEVRGKKLAMTLVGHDEGPDFWLGFLTAAANPEA